MDRLYADIEAALVEDRRTVRPRARGALAEAARGFMCGDTDIEAGWEKTRADQGGRLPGLREKYAPKRRSRAWIIQAMAQG